MSSIRTSFSSGLMSPFCRSHLASDSGMSMCRMSPSAIWRPIGGPGTLMATSSPSLASSTLFLSFWMDLTLPMGLPSSRMRRRPATRGPAGAAAEAEGGGVAQAEEVVAQEQDLARVDVLLAVAALQPRLLLLAPGVEL